MKTKEKKAIVDAILLLQKHLPESVDDLEIVIRKEAIDIVNNTTGDMHLYDSSNPADVPHVLEKI